MKTESILLVDDNNFALKELVNVLKYTGYKNLKMAGNFNDAVSFAESESFHCIIAAWDMDKGSGIDLLKKIRANDNFINLPFFLTDSAYTKQKVMKAGFAGVTGLIVTPYNTNNLTLKLKTISEIIEKPFFVKEIKNLKTGMTLLEKGHYKEAIAALDEVVNSDETAEYYYNIGYIKMREEKYGEAIPAFQKATQLDSLFAKAFEGLGKAFSALGQSGEAEKYMKIAADIYLETNKIDDAESILNDILKISTDSVNIFNSLGVLYRKKGDFEAALKHYKKAIKVHPTGIYILYNIGRLYIDMKEAANAVEYFERALAIQPDFQEARDVLDAIKRGII